MTAKTDDRRRPSDKRHFALNLQLNDASLCQPSSRNLRHTVLFSILPTLSLKANVSVRLTAITLLPQTTPSHFMSPATTS